MRLLKSKIVVISIILAALFTIISLGYSKYICVSGICTSQTNQIQGPMDGVLLSCTIEDCVATVVEHGFPLSIYNESIYGGLNCGEPDKTSGVKYQIGFIKSDRNDWCVNRSKPKAVALVGDFVFYFVITYLVLKSAQLITKKLKKY